MSVSDALPGRLTLREMRGIEVRERQDILPERTVDRAAACKGTPERNVDALW